MDKASQIVLNTQDSVAPIGIIAMNGTQELGTKINNYLVKWANEGGLNVDSFLVETQCPRFSSGD
ncbi:MAG: ribose-phosphate pyrophosphokinase, partial [Ruminiclostridium sp.]